MNRATSSANDPTRLSLSSRSCDAVLFDLDGVLTKTAIVHARAWKRLLDEMLEQRRSSPDEEIEPFDIESDYRLYVDGKPRMDGVVSFLASRGIELPKGAEDDEPGYTSVHALGRLKDRYFLEHLETNGVEPYEPAIALVGMLRTQGIRTAVVSSSNNCAAVLAATNIADLFDVRVDGRDSAQLGLAGKPAPDAFLEAASRLRVVPQRSVVVEDAIAGVAAGRAGDFMTVVGVDRGGQAQALHEAGADTIVTSLAQLTVADDALDDWILEFEGFDPAQEGRREALCALGNGYFSTRGAAPEVQADGIHYPGTYLAGGYNRLITNLAGRQVLNEELVNLANWVTTQFRIGGEPWFSVDQVTITEYRQSLDLKRGLLTRTVRFSDEHRRFTRLVERRFVSMANMHSAALHIELTPENWSGELTMRSGIDGQVANKGAKLYRHFNKVHLVPSAIETIEPDSVLLSTRTTQSGLEVAQAAKMRVYIDGEPVQPARHLVESPGYIAQEFTVSVSAGQKLALEKHVSLFTSRDNAIADCVLEARKAIARAKRFDALMAPHVLAWRSIWRRFDAHWELVLPAASDRDRTVSMLMRLNKFHLLQTVTLHSIGRDIGVPARGWTGEAYQGHVFWDELFIFPFFNYRMPEITRSLLMYRWRRLGEARAAAQHAGFQGAMFPWQSGSNGEEVTQARNFNARSERWITDNSYLQRHVGSAIAYNVWQYFQVTNDVEFLEFYGAELMLDIASFWSSIAQFNVERGRYEICGVMGPDEFHDAYPGSSHPGLKNNAYSNLMAAWVLCRALEVLDRLTYRRREELMSQLAITPTEIERWDDVSRRMFVPIRADGIIEQFEGYDNLEEFDWTAYSKRDSNLQRLDLILEAEGDSPNRYKVSKQPDVLMLFYLFSAEELRDTFMRLSLPFEYQTIPDNVAYYDQRTSHGSTLGRVVHAWVLGRSDRPRAAQYFDDALRSDVDDIQQGTTAEGIHLGAMAGSVDLLQRMSTGLEVTNDILRVNSELPAELERLDVRVRYRGHSLDLSLKRNQLTIRGHEPNAASIRVGVKNDVYDFHGGTTRVFNFDSQKSG
ncbi:MAG: HAD-IA family hydrolase [Burkholderiaceae bacterium]